MSLIAISYDLSNPKRDYDKLIEAIKKYGNWCHVQGSFWLIRTTSSVTEVRDYLAQFIDSDDDLFVGEMTGVIAWKNLGKKKSDWLHGVPV